MRLLVGVLTTLGLGLGLVVAAPSARAEQADVDPAVRAAFLAAVDKSYATAWRKRGGTWDNRCDVTSQTWADEVSPLADGRSTYTLDVRRGIKKVVDRSGGALPKVVVLHGHKKYVKTPAAVRAALRIHRAPMSPPWVVRSHDVAVPSPTEHLPAPATRWEDVSWTWLTRSTLPNGGTRFLGTIDEGSAVEGTTATSKIDFATDASGRFVRGTTQAQGATAYRTYRTTCLQTWSWSRPRIEVPRKVGKHPSSKRYDWERRATHGALGTTWMANLMLRRGDSKAAVMAWLRGFAFRKDQRLKNGVRYVMPGPHTAPTKVEPRVAFEIRVRDGEASYSAVR